MTRKKKAPKVSDANTLNIVGEPGKSRAEMIAKIAVMPTMTAAMVSGAFSRTFGEVDMTATHDALLEQTTRVHTGDMRCVESTLVAQAAALNSIFTDLARSARRAELLSQFEANLKLALRAQNQCRKTLETLATIKNPPVVFAKQANIANNQQVNNGEAVSVTRAGENARLQTELLEAPNAKPEWMDAGAARAAKEVDSVMATVEAIDRATNQGGEGNVKP